MAIKLKSNSAYDGQVQETNTAARQYYLPNNDSGLGTQLMTAQASTSGTSIDFTSIPSWVKRITVMFHLVSTNGSSPIVIRLGSSSGGVETSGYNGNVHSLGTSTMSSTNVTNGIQPMVNGATTSMCGLVSIVNLTSSTWAYTGSVSEAATSGGGLCDGSKALSSTLDRVRVTTVNGTDTFDAGSINVMYE